MKTPSADPREMARELAFKGKSLRQIRRELDKHQLGGRLDSFTLDNIVAEGRTARSLLIPTESTFLPRLVGVVAILMGLAGCYVGSRIGHFSLRSSPGGYGRLAIILGCILVVKPGWAKAALDFKSW